MTEEIEQLLRNLHLRRIAEIFDDELAVAEKKHLSYSELTVRLLRAQWQHRQESALQWRIKRAGLPEQWTLESFPFKRQPSVSQRQIRGFAELDFIGRAENIVFIGPTGVGKTGLASGLLLKALQNGYRALFLRAQDLFDEMYASLADRSSRKLDLPRFRGRLTAFALSLDFHDLSTPSPAPVRRGSTYCSGQAPALPVGSPAWRVAQRRAGDLDPEDLAGVGDHEITNPLHKGWSASRRRMLGGQCLLEGPALGVREAHEHPMAAGMRCRRPADLRHATS